MNPTKTPPATTLPSTPCDSRLYVGNLSPAVDEFALVALFSKFGKISKLDFLFHKSGVLRGKPRGYAFIEMNRRDEALKAMVELNNKPVRGKRILVTPANESQYQEHQAAIQAKPNYHHSHQNHSNHQGRPSQRGGRPATSDPMRPTTLSILKSQQLPKGVNNKIAALEAKLASMQHNQSASTICAATTSTNQPLPQSSSSSGLTSIPKPSFLPENPTIFGTTGVNASHPNQQLAGRPSSYHSVKSNGGSRGVSTNNKNGTRSSSVGGAKSSRNHAPSAATMKHAPNLEAVGLTLKEQLKRNRESKLTMAESTKISQRTNTVRVESGQTLDAEVPASRDDQDDNSHPSHRSPPSLERSQNCTNNPTNETGEIQPSTYETNEIDTGSATDSFKRQKVDHDFVPLA